MYEAKLEFPGGMGGAKEKTFCGGSVDIFWNCTILYITVCNKKDTKRQEPGAESGWR